MNTLAHNSEYVSMCCWSIKVTLVADAALTFNGRLVQMLD